MGMASLVRSSQLRGLEDRQFEWLATMRLLPAAGNPSAYAGLEIEERFPGRIYAGQLEAGDLLRRSGGPQSISEVLQRSYIIPPGQPTTFQVLPDGTFLDHHGGMGLEVVDPREWFTEEALNRGISTWFFQDFYQGDRWLARFRIERKLTMFTFEGGGFVADVEIAKTLNWARPLPEGG
jgi:hypothetical protein